ncbi:hypothetical protein SUNI508_01956 [Seiridium unicorne]|uniref:Uncharacterized protein n=1 Tax=Seiridium unicorne TaxID=138068 RepID=A0ABR2UKU1_9PEZI
MGNTDLSEDARKNANMYRREREVVTTASGDFVLSFIQGDMEVLVLTENKTWDLDDSRVFAARPQNSHGPASSMAFGQPAPFGATMRHPPGFSSQGPDKALQPSFRIRGIRHFPSQRGQRGAVERHSTTGDISNIESSSHHKPGSSPSAATRDHTAETEAKPP